jgi:membrane protein
MQELLLDLNRVSGDRLEILRDAFLSFSAMRASQGAASLAYYAIFSLFPLLLVFIIVGSLFVESGRVYAEVIWAVERIFPVSPGLIEENITYVLKQRGSASILVLVTLIWSATGFFTNLAYNINLAWVNAPPRKLLDKYLIGLVMVLVLAGLLIISIIAGWFAQLFPFVGSLGSSSSLHWLWVILSSLGSWLLVFLLFLALYRWIPTVHISWPAALWAALVASIGWKLATTIFAWYLGSGLNRYNLVYGSLGAIIALLFLIYLISTITLFGAHLSASIDGRVKRRREELTLMKGD